MAIDDLRDLNVSIVAIVDLANQHYGGTQMNQQIPAKYCKRLQTREKLASS